VGRDAEERGEKRRERRETMIQPQQHCDHECVCPDYKASHSENGEDGCYGDPDPCSLSCYHRSRPYQSERDKVLDVGGILESLCKTDLYWYNKGVTEGEDVGKCRGKDCNYCGRYNEKLRQQAGEP